MLMIKARLKHGDTVLVHAGCSPVGLAAISIANSYGCKVFATVAEQYQRAHLKKKFTFVSKFKNSFGSCLILFFLVAGL